MQAFAAFLLARGDLPELPNVGTGNERLSGADQHNSLHALGRLGLVDRFDDPLGHARTERVDGRVVHGDDADLTILDKRN